MFQGFLFCRFANGQLSDLKVPTYGGVVCRSAALAPTVRSFASGQMLDLKVPIYGGVVCRSAALAPTLLDDQWGQIPIFSVMSLQATPVGGFLFFARVRPWACSWSWLSCTDPASLACFAFCLWLLPNL